MYLYITAVCKSILLKTRKSSELSKVNFAVGCAVVWDLQENRKKNHCALLLLLCSPFFQILAYNWKKAQAFRIKVFSIIVTAIIISQKNFYLLFIERGISQVYIIYFMKKPYRVSQKFCNSQISSTGGIYFRKKCWIQK